MHYRLYFLDQYDHIRSALDFAAPDDASAVVTASDSASGRCVEVWRGAVRVGRIEPPEPTPFGGQRGGSLFGRGKPINGLG